MSINIAIINGPNLNMLGKRETDFYGKQTLENINEELEKKYKDKAVLHFFQSNIEGDILSYIHSLYNKQLKGIVINAAALTHSSIALRDALLSVSIPFIEVHISNVHKREDFRNISYLSDIANGVITGLGYKVYHFAIDYFLEFDTL